MLNMFLILELNLNIKVRSIYKKSNIFAFTDRFVVFYSNNKIPKRIVFKSTMLIKRPSGPVRTTKPFQPHSTSIYSALPAARNHLRLSLNVFASFRLPNSLTNSTVSSALGWC